MNTPRATFRSVVLLAALAAAALGALPASAAVAPVPAAGPAGIQKIQHVVIIMQENRSFDSYFGTFPGADGIPMRGRQHAVCVPDPASGQRVPPSPPSADLNHGGPHSANAAAADVNRGRMDGFIGQAEHGKMGCK